MPRTIPATILLVQISMGCTSDKDSTKTGDPEDSTADSSPRVDSQDSGDTGEPFSDRSPNLVLAIIGDYGMNNDAEAAVASLVHGWEPDFVLTVGDNNYPNGEASTIDANIGQYYQQYIASYTGKYGEGAKENAFYPCPGNHDWFGKDALTPYTEYFELPGNERYYEVSLGEEGLLDLFCVDSDSHEPDGYTADSVQAAWLAEALKASEATWRVVTLHHAPYSSGVHRDNDNLKWPYGPWGAQVVLAGHDHNYERVVQEGVLYTVNGAGGAALRHLEEATTGTQVWDVSHYGAQRIRIYGEWMIAEFIGTNGELIDQVHVHAEHSLDTNEVLIPGGSSWHYLDTGEEPSASWTTTGFDDSSWPEGSAPLGYGIDDMATTVDHGLDEENKHISTWFRHGFEVEDPEDWTQMTVHLRRDDGALVYLNGSLIMRSNLPDTVDADTLALEIVTDEDETSFFTEAVNLGLLQAGDNVIAVELHQSSASSSDLGFDLMLEVEGGPELISTGAQWQWSTEGDEDYSTPDFDAADWSEGPSPLGYGNGDEATETTEGTISTWFRHEFEISKPGDYEALLLLLERDDGARVMLNGTEVLRSNLPEGDLDPEALAFIIIEEVWEDAQLSSHIDPELLVSGTNVIGVEVHQVSDTSSDLSMDLVLIAR